MGSPDETVVCVIPTYNEKQNLKTLIPSLQEIFRKNKLNGVILVVDDHSPDGTGQLVKEFSKRYGNVYLVSQPKRMGLGLAYKTGFTYALEKLNGKVIIQMDGDCSHNPTYMSNFLEKINEGYDVIVGCRYIEGGGIIGWSLRRKLISRLANNIARLLTGIKLNDLTNGYRAFTNQALKKINPNKLNSKGFDFQMEVLFMAKKSGLKIAEVPLVFVNRRKGKSKLTFEEILKFSLTCLRLSVQRISQRQFLRKEIPKT